MIAFVFFFFFFFLLSDGYESHTTFIPAISHASMFNLGSGMVAHVHFLFQCLNQSKDIVDGGFG